MLASGLTVLGGPTLLWKRAVKPDTLGTPRGLWLTKFPCAQIPRLQPNDQTHKRASAQA